MTETFTGRTALVTGASREIGFGIAHELLTLGASVAITGRKPEHVPHPASRTFRHRESNTRAPRT